ncbi:hypothetical protein [Actinomadura rayongensis]|uniref:Uncharacterized protein n=1 Tax=Actinomadura rayongensis TaxID=1429076 RepID=A0A6I4W557_9ACTN|nr:hypothetical protein [Actinomadura rayongensis]MXQ64433.1 hypothetical protein [Actinomadura rayongensis]
MVQVDVFWAYGVGAGFALAAAHDVRDRRLTAVVLYCSAVFTPACVWLLWGFPEWETMQAGGRSLPAWLAAAFTAANTVQGVAGYLVARWLIGRGAVRWAALQFVAGYYAMFFVLVHGWDGTGYQRVLSTDRADFRRWGDRSFVAHVVHWAGSDVALTLYGVGTVLVVSMLVPLYRAYRDGLRSVGRPGPGPVELAVVVFGSLLLTLAAAVFTSLLIRLFTGFTGVVAGWSLGVAVAAPSLWLVVVRRGALASAVVRRLALPADRQDGRADAAARRSRSR